MANFIQRIWDALDRGSRFVTHDVWFVGREGEEVPYGFVIKQVRVMIMLVQNMVQDALMLRAAALTYTTLLALVPFLAVVYFVIQQFDLGPDIAVLVTNWTGRKSEITATSGKSDDPNQQVKEFIDLLVPGLSQGMDGERPSAPSQGATTEQPSVTPQEQPGPAETQSAQEMQNPIDWLLDTASQSANPRALGTMGIIFILTAIFGLMRNIESSFNSIWGLKRTRSWYRMFSDYMMVTLLLPFVIMAVLGVTAALGSDAVLARLGALSYGVRGIQYLAIWLAFSALYAIVPNTKVKWRYAVLGGIVAGTLWVLTSWAYFGLQMGLSRNSLVYSSFALFPLLLIWIYLSWVILLFGAELTFAYQNEKTFAMERHAAGASQAYREALALRAMVEIGRRFDAGLPGLSTSQAAEDWKVPLRLLNETLDQLDEAGLVQRCATEPVTFSPARSIDRITIGDVVAALREAGREPSPLRKEEMLQPLLNEVNGRQSKLMSASLSEVIHCLHPPHPALAVDEEPGRSLPAPENEAAMQTAHDESSSDSEGKTDATS